MDSNGNDGAHGATHAMWVRPIAGECYEISVRGHRVRVDQPLDAGGDDLAPTPTELFVASLASCVATLAGSYLTRHGYDRAGLGVSVAYEMAADPPPRVAAVRLTLRVPPGLPETRRAGLLAVASRCTVHNSIEHPPVVELGIAATHD
jgi:putative redox protein